MPYSGPNDEKIPDHVPEKKKAQWVKVWNNTYASCISDGGGKSSCETKAFKAANGAIKRSKTMDEKSFWNTLKSFAADLNNLVTGFQQRAVSISSVGNTVFEEFYNQGAWLNDLYYENGEMFAVASEGGKLFRTAITIDDNGDVQLGEMTEVVTKFDSVNRSSMQTSDEGKVQMLSVSATSVINHDGQIDSRDLFDSMVDYIERTGKKIPRTFYHAGPEFRTGDIVFMARDENVLITLTEFDSSELAEREIKTREKEPDYWGDSIEFDPVGDPEMHDVGDGITIPVYRAGIPLAVSTVPADKASSHYANRFSIQKQEVKRMTLRDDQKEVLAKKYFDGSEGTDEWLEKNVSVINREIADTDQVTRDVEEEEVTEEEPVEEEPSEELEDEVTEEEPVAEEVEEEPEEELAETEPTETILEFGDDEAQEVADVVMQSSAFEDFKTELMDFAKGIETQLSELAGTVEQLQAASVARSKDIAELKKTDAEKQEIWMKDLPKNTVKIRATHRPRDNAADEEPEEASMEEIANETLAELE
jgi:hypothetical protein